jgi:von Willebrand factor type A domain
MPENFADRVRLLLARSGGPVVGTKAGAGPAVARPAAVAKFEPRARLVFAVDATASRSAAWETAKGLTDTLIGALPGQLEVSLAVHGGDRVHTFTEFSTSARKLRKVAAAVRCKVGATRLLEILARVLGSEGVRVVVYIGDTFEECETEARVTADMLGARGIRIIILHDTSGRHYSGGDVFADMARRTGGAVIPFDPSAVRRLRELLAAVAVLAVGGPSLLAKRADTMAAAGPLLRQISSGSSSS